VIATGYAGGGENLPRTYHHISFAIIEDHNSNKEHNPGGNLLPFQNRFANGLDDKFINNVSDAVEHTLHISQESPERPRQDKNNQRNQNQNRQSNYERRGRGGDRGGGRGGRGGGRGGGKGNSREGSQQLTLDDIWKYKPSQDHVDQLTRMGYSGKNARRALYTTKGNMEEAVIWLKQNAIPNEMTTIRLSLDE
jgi:hypothetical protein